MYGRRRSRREDSFGPDWAIRYVAEPGLRAKRTEGAGPRRFRDRRSVRGRLTHKAKGTPAGAEVRQRSCLCEAFDGPPICSLGNGDASASDDRYHLISIRQMTAHFLFGMPILPTVAMPVPHRFRPIPVARQQHLRECWPRTPAFCLCAGGMWTTMRNRPLRATSMFLLQGSSCSLASRSSARSSWASSSSSPWCCDGGALPKSSILLPASSQ